MTFWTKEKKKTNKRLKNCIYKIKEQNGRDIEDEKSDWICMLYDCGRTDSFDVPAGFDLRYLYYSSISDTRLRPFLLLRQKKITKKPG